MTFIYEGLIKIEPNEVTQLGTHNVQIQACLKHDEAICTTSELQEVRIYEKETCFTDATIGPSFGDFDTVVGVTNQTALSITSPH